MKTILTSVLLCSLLCLALIAPAPVHAQSDSSDGNPQITLGVYPPLIHAYQDETFGVTVSNFPQPGYPAYLVVGAQLLIQPFGDYIMYPTIDFTQGIVSPFPQSASTTFHFAVPAGTLPDATVLTFQVWQDADLGPGTDWRGSNWDDLSVIP